MSEKPFRVTIIVYDDTWYTYLSAPSNIDPLSSMKPGSRILKSYYLDEPYEKGTAIRLGRYIHSIRGRKPETLTWPDNIEDFPEVEA